MRTRETEKLEVNLTTELIERMDDVVELLDLGNREVLVICAILRYVDQYSIISKSTTSTI